MEECLSPVSRVNLQCKMIGRRLVVVERGRRLLRLVRLPGVVVDAAASVIEDQVNAGGNCGRGRVGTIDRRAGGVAVGEEGLRSGSGWVQDFGGLVATGPGCLKAW